MSIYLYLLIFGFMVILIVYVITEED